MAGKNSNILVLNAGSSSIKFAIFDTELNEEISGIAEGIGGASSLTIAGERIQSPFIDHQSALKAVLNALDAKGYAPNTLAAVGHRVVHGGRKLTTPMRVNADVLAEIGQ
ncbi:MAG: acetate kinase, partial [Paracoccaceae bacterium]